MPKTELQVIISAEDRASTVFKSVQRNLQNYGKQLTSLGNKMTKGLTLPIVGAGLAALKMGADFDRAMKPVQAIAKAAGATEDELRMLTNLAIEFGKKGVFSPTEVAQAMQDMVRDGMKPAEIAAGRLAAVYEGAAAMGTNMANVQILLSDVMQAFGINASESMRVMDVFTEVTTGSTYSFEELAGAMTYVSGTAGKLGISLEKTAALLMKMAETGLRGQMAGRYLRMALMQLTEPRVVEHFKSIGVAVFDAQGKMRDITDIINDLRNALRGMSEEEKIAFLQAKMGTVSVDALSRMLREGGTSIAEYTKIVEQQGKTTKVADDMTKGLDASIRSIRASIEVLAINVLPLFASLLKTIADAVRTAVQRFNELDPSIRNIIMILTGLIAVIGPLIVVIGTMSAAIAAISTPVAIAIAAIMGLITAGTLLYLKWDWIKNYFQLTWEGIKLYFQDAIDKITVTLEQWRETWGNVWDWIVDKLKRAWELIKSPLDEMKNAFENIINLAQRVVQSITGIFSGAVKSLPNIVPFQEGGIVTRPTLGLLGEAGPEMVVPLKRRIGGIGNITVNIQGGTYLSEEAAEEIGNMIIDKLKTQLRF